MNITTRVLAIDPTTKGFGWIVFEGPDRIIDWGIARISPVSNARCLKRLDALMDRYPPDVVVLEDLAQRGPRRSVRAQQLILSMEKLARKRGSTVRHFSRDTIRLAFAEAGAWTHDQIANAIALKHRDLAPWLPPERKIWMSEDHRMGIFDAAALALTYFHRVRRRRRASKERSSAAA